MSPCRFFEALKDPKGWLFMLFATIGSFVGGAGIQYSLIIKDFGFNIMQTTLLNIPSGACQVISVTFWMWMLRKYPVSNQLTPNCH
jgi:ACS family allantoate permease-like MFS transporter